MLLPNATLSPTLRYSLRWPTLSPLWAVLLIVYVYVGGGGGEGED